MKIGDSKVIDFNDINKRNILIVIILMIFFIGTTTMIYHYGYDKGYKEGTTKTTTTTDSYTSPSLTTEITAASKTNTSDPDLILNNHYHAVINGNDIQIPVKDKYIKKTLKDTPLSPSSSTTSTPTTARVDQTLDLTPIFKDYEKKHKWEVGAGIGRVSNEWYVPIEVQRNFGYNKGVSFQLNVKDNKVDGFQASYKIRF
jgi:hypothetical protein|nr:MAG TPA: hypothetical protein [Caudoviricetes sp.]